MVFLGNHFPPVNVMTMLRDKPLKRLVHFLYINRHILVKIQMNMNII